MKLDFDVVIIGAGVAGMTASLYLKRANVSCCLLEKEMPGGQINRTSAIENYPGIKSITGPELAEAIFSQITEHGVIYQYGDVIEIIDKEEYKIIKTKTGEISCKYVIVATGRRPRKLEIENEEKLMNRGLSWCAICDGPLYKGKKVAVVGGGDSAIEESNYLSTICETVTILSRNHELRAQPHLIEKIITKKNVTIKYGVVPKKFIDEDNRLSAIEVEDIDYKTSEVIPIEGCFIYVGQTPNTDFLQNLNILDEYGYITTDTNGETKIKNVFACGDVIKKPLYQIVSATSDGALVATSIVNRR